jgi:hypothetical protein
LRNFQKNYNFCSSSRKAIILTAGIQGGISRINPALAGLSLTQKLGKKAIYGWKPMSHNHTHPTMSQRIFKLGLPVETVSAYLLCCGISDLGEPITKKRLLEVWNSSKEALEQGLQDLENRHIIQRIISDREEKSVYKIIDEKKWKIKKGIG